MLPVVRFIWWKSFSLVAQARVWFFNDGYRLGLVRNWLMVLNILIRTELLVIFSKWCLWDDRKWLKIETVLAFDEVFHDEFRGLDVKLFFLTFSWAPSFVLLYGITVLGGLVGFDFERTVLIIDFLLQIGLDLKFSLGLGDPRVYVLNLLVAVRTMNSNAHKLGQGVVFDQVRPNVVLIGFASTFFSIRRQMIFFGLRDLYVDHIWDNHHDKALLKLRVAAVDFTLRLGKRRGCLVQVWLCLDFSINLWDHDRDEVEKSFTLETLKCVLGSNHEIQHL